MAKRLFALLKEHSKGVLEYANNLNGRVAGAVGAARSPAGGGADPAGQSGTPSLDFIKRHRGASLQSAHPALKQSFLAGGGAPQFEGMHAQAMAMLKFAALYFRLCLHVANTLYILKSQCPSTFTI